MCDHQHHSHRAVALEQGQAHDDDHAAWSRRDFLMQSGLVAVGGTIMLNGTPVKALGGSSLLDHLAQLETDRVLVLIQLSGGNDGLNTIIPKTNDLYYAARPTIAIHENQTVYLGDEYGLNPAMIPLEAMWGEGDMAVVHSVGYPTPQLSHFRSTDIWTTASDSQEVLTTGWAGRYLETEYPEYATNPPDAPPAVQIGTSTPLLFQGAGANLGMTLVDVELFLEIAAGGTPYDPGDVPDTAYGDELAFVRTVANDSFRYLEAIQEATDAAQNTAAYPVGAMPDALAACARLIKGRLDTRIFIVSLGGFDTHADQANEHTNLLETLSEAVKAFYEDLSETEDGDRVLTMTFSEFGRRIAENGSGGTDHGTAAPLIVFGKDVNGGLYGDGPDLENTESGNLVFSTDFRSVYSTVLQDWFGLEEATVSSVLGGSFEILPLVGNPIVTGELSETPDKFVLAQNYPNPFNPSTVITYTLGRAGRVRLRVFDERGRHVTTLVDEAKAAGTHRAHFDAGRLPSGVYLYRIEAPDGALTQRMTLIR